MPCSGKSSGNVPRVDRIPVREAPGMWSAVLFERWLRAEAELRCARRWNLTADLTNLRAPRDRAERFARGRGRLARGPRVASRDGGLAAKLGVVLKEAARMIGQPRGGQEVATAVPTPHADTVSRGRSRSACYGRLGRAIEARTASTISRVASMRRLLSWRISQSISTRCCVASAACLDRNRAARTIWSRHVSIA